MIELKEVCKNTEEAAACEALSRRAFPPEEFSSLYPLMEDDTGHGRVLSIREDGAFAGFLATLTVKDICHILYFAVEEKLRGRGIGSSALALLAEKLPGYRIIADIEQPVSGAANLPERKQRRAFYLRSGFSGTETRYRWRGVDYEILARGGNVTQREFWEFWETLERTDKKYSSY